MSNLSCFCVFLVYLISLPLYSHQENDTLFLSAVFKPSSEYFSYYIDSSAKKNVEEIALCKDQFHAWGTQKSLNLGLNPYPLWLHLTISSTFDYKKKYWLSFYTQADSIFIFEKKDDLFVCNDTLCYNTAQNQRKVKTRFLASSVYIDAHESKEFYMKLMSFTKTQNFIVDLTTPESNLLWERNFSWFVFFFTGCFSLVSFISFLLSFVIRQKIFFLYGIYLTSIMLLLLSQELMLPIFPAYLFSFLNSFHPMSIAIIGLYIHYYVILYIVEHQENNRKMIDVFKRMSTFFLYYGLITLFCYFFCKRMMLTTFYFYHLLYSSSVVIILFQLSITFITVVLSGSGIIRKISNVFVASVLIYFNPAGYYLNYSGIVHYYEITYPNYFYWFMCIEFVALGYFISWKYRKMAYEKDFLIKKTEQLEQESYLRELEAQERKQNQIARDLHDDLGATLSALKLIITNNYKTDSHLVNMISKANSDLRYFFNRLSSSGLKEKGLFKMLEEKKQELNKTGTIHFSSIFIGNDKSLSDKMMLALYRISTELLSNILKHSMAQEASLQLIIDDKQIEIITEDNGKGYNTAQKSKGMGLENIRTRTQQLNGHIHISSANSGTTTIITIPK